MIWADRFAIGVFALIILTFSTMLIADWPSTENRGKQDAATPPAVDCSKSVAPKSVQNLSDQDLMRLLVCPNKNGSGSEIKAANTSGGASPFESVMAILQMALVVTIPLWLAFRILDFMFGGPKQRGAKELIPTRKNR